ncbi:MAG: hypothetical protein VXZ40_01190, partial [Nanoarchaeota archaeon]|nr:hypothetical protein [Nanoarchaeota archaeon]
TYGMGKVVDETSNPVQGTLSDLGYGLGYIEQVCNWVTCENTLLPGVENFFEDLQFDMSFATCSILNDPSSLFGGEQ